MNKIRSLILILVGGMASLTADVNHVVVYYDGHTEVGLIDSMNAKTLFMTRKYTGQAVSILLKDVYFAYNDFDRLFYVSPSFGDRIDQIEQYSGVVVTLDGERFPFKKFYYNRNFIAPRVYLTTPTDSLFSLSLFSVHHVELDFSTLSLSVAKGFHRSAGLFLGLTAWEILGGWRQSLKHTKLISMTSVNSLASNSWKYGQKLLPRADPAGIHQTGVRFESMILSFSLFTVGQMAWDIWRGNRNHYFFPLDRQERFPRSMYQFSVRRWFRQELESIRQQISP